MIAKVRVLAERASGLMEYRATREFLFVHLFLRLDLESRLARWEGSEVARAVVARIGSTHEKVGLLMQLAVGNVPLPNFSSLLGTQLAIYIMWATVMYSVVLESMNMDLIRCKCLFTLVCLVQT